MDKRDRDILESAWLWVKYAMLPPAIVYYFSGAYGGEYQLFLNYLISHPHLLFVTLTAICIAVMDSVENEHFFTTIFSGLNQKFWYKRVSWNVAKKIFGWKLDAWHLFKSIGLISGGLACIYFKAEHPLLLELAMIAYIYNWAFNLFYNVIFQK